MRVLLDNCIPRKFARHIAGHDVTSVVRLGWDTLKDGVLLDTAEGRFDAVVTVDKNIRFQNWMDHRSFALVVLRQAKSNWMTHLFPRVPALLAALGDVKPGDVREIGGEDRSCPDRPR